MKAKHVMKLRRLAERKLATSANKRVSLPRSPRALRHELQVHQIELELQNEELRRAQAELERSRDRYRDLYDCAPVGYFSLNGTGRIVSINRAGAVLLGVDGTGQAKAFGALVAPAHLPRWANHLALLREGGTQTCEVALEPRGATPFIAQLTSVMAIEPDDVATVRCTLLDVTSRHQAEEERARRFSEMVDLTSLLRQRETQLVRADRLVAVGQLAAGVAQGLESPLGVLSSRLGLMQKCLADLAWGSPREASLAHSELGGYAADAQRCLTLVSKVVSSLTSFPEVGPEPVEEVELERLVEGSAQLIASILDQGRLLKRDYWWQPLQLKCRPLQLHQVVTNLLLNAARATAQGGTITLRTGRDGSEVWIEVQDSGPGLSRAQLGRIFEPLVTSGAGLGLNVAQDLVRQHGGRLEVASEPEVGSRFRVVLPIGGPAERTAFSGR
jgi:signal transduction histidine kinase